MVAGVAQGEGRLRSCLSLPPNTTVTPSLPPTGLRSQLQKSRRQTDFPSTPWSPLKCLPFIYYIFNLIAFYKPVLTFERTFPMR